MNVEIENVMHSQRIIETLVKEHDITQNEASKIWDSFCRNIMGAVMSYAIVSIPGFGMIQMYGKEQDSVVIHYLNMHSAKSVKHAVMLNLTKSSKLSNSSQ
ncbi:HU family DNA-binding protein [Candidatus Fokinia crypta]|uniref:Uncharacterized protein n=1 Tax=Candidatus Fokinia crypta TaxID=1920990 RepID=A0ABZ0USF6_9RICK|nr:HU family DNA-binding protein [Candidatus Fokinia cryptica]WPX97964.1 hypothetical protein Fokcrypt_00489 [Candidatus Fokinia cryptica]